MGPTGVVFRNLAIGPGASACDSASEHIYWVARIREISARKGCQRIAGPAHRGRIHETNQTNQRRENPATEGVLAAKLSC